MDFSFGEKASQGTAGDVELELGAGVGVGARETERESSVICVALMPTICLVAT